MATKVNPDLKKGMEDMKQHHAASLSAIHESGKTLHKGMTDIHQSISEHIADSFNSTMEAMKSMFSAKTPQEAAAIHKEWLQGSVKNHMDKTTQISQKTAALFKEASQPMHDLSKQATQEATAKTFKQ
ncbi:MAG: phasin family protein [Alphaproteobacteria bacterium]|nr:phasin family protein [Alphaproteobacteria bacterium]